MWVEIRYRQFNSGILGSSSLWGCELKYMCFWLLLRLWRHPPCEDVSWNVFPLRECTWRSGHPPCEDVSWNFIIHQFNPFRVVILLVRMWVEIRHTVFRYKWWHVILLVRMWVEMTYFLYQSLYVIVILLVRMWVEIFRRHLNWIKRSSSSLWGCELKWKDITGYFQKYMSSSLWGCELKWWNQCPYRCQL